MTAYHNWDLMHNPPPGFYGEADAAMLAAREVCEIAGGYSERQKAEAMADAMYPVMYRYGLIYDEPSVESVPVCIIDGVEYVARKVL